METSKDFFEDAEKKQSNKTAKDFFNKYVDELKVGETFQTYDVRRYINFMSKMVNNEVALPMDQTLTRYFRERRELKGDIALKDHQKSIYEKIEVKNEKDFNNQERQLHFS
jgi:hypothetical protein